MATALTKELLALQEEVARFSREKIASRPELGSLSEFPWDIWRSIGQAGFLGLGIPKEYGGQGRGYLALAVAGEALVRHGGNLGFALSVSMHHIVARFLILGFGDSRQREEYLPRMARGEITGCLALSEPESGAHPKYLKTTAVVQGDAHRLDGEKTYLTNGPIADFFVVVAITGMDDDRKRLTAFLVPGRTVGLSQTGPMILDFLRPSPHGGIKLSAAMVPAKNVLGQEGQAYEQIMKPFREVEDAVLMGPMVGGMARQLELVAGLIRKQAITPSEEVKSALGRLQFLVDQARILTYEVSLMLDSPGHPEFLSLLLAGRDLGTRFQSDIESLIAICGIKPSADLEHLTKDLVLTGNIAKNVALRKQVKMGEGVLLK